MQTLGDLGAALMDEGPIGMLLDPTGALDRQRSQRELAGRFEVVGDDYDGPRSPNTVSETEYEMLARTYSDIRLGRSDIVIEGPDELSNYDQSAEEFEAAAMDDIADIMQTNSGRDLIRSLDDNRQVDENGEVDHKHTYLTTRTDSTGFADTDGANTAHLDDGDSIILINPNRDVGDAEMTTRSDVALYHEMVHAHHHSHGTTAEGFVERGDLPGDRAVADDAAHNEAQTDDAKKVGRDEHQATGLGVFADHYYTANNYRDERIGVGLSGLGQGGDLTMAQRLDYSNLYFDEGDFYDPNDGS
jgi:hypothetical protein